MSLLPQGRLAVFTVQDNGKPLATMGNCEGAKAPVVKLIAPILILHHGKSAIAPVMKLVCL
jgi:hypothetical protein